MSNNLQENTWSSDFGREYTERHVYDYNEENKTYKEIYGISREDLNNRFLGEIDKSQAKILEVGCNVGIQLRMLQGQGFKKLYGIELQPYAVERAKELSKGINIIQGTGEDIPFKDGYFDLVFTSGVLIHISPDNISKVLDEIYRCSNKYIWGFEYYADTYTEIEYRGNKNLLWKTDFAKLYLDRFPNLELVKEEKYKYTGNDNVDSMYLLRKK